MARNSRFRSSGKPARKPSRESRGESGDSSRFQRTGKSRRNFDRDSDDKRPPKSRDARGFGSEKPSGFRNDRFGKGTRRGPSKPGFGRRPATDDQAGEGKSFPGRFGSKRSGGSFRQGSSGFSKRDGDRPERSGSRFGKRSEDRFGESRGGRFEGKPDQFKKREGDRFGKREGGRFGKTEGDRFGKGPGDRYGKKEPYRSDKESRFERKEGKRSFVESRLERQRQSPGTERKRDAEKTDDGLIRLNKFISNSGVCSRREADDLIRMGLITVNGKSITEMGYKVKPGDDVRYEGKKLTAESMVYILLNKPKGYITTTDDPQERNTVMQIIAGACKQRVYPVGRLDRNTSGLLLLTNDGDLTDKLTHPSYNVKKIYKVELDKPLTKADFQKVREGVQLEEGKAMIDDLAVVSEDGKTIGIEIHIGWNRVIRRIFEALGYEVVKLDRSVYAGLDKKDLPRGHWRFLRQEEVIRLKHYK